MNRQRKEPPRLIEALGHIEDVGNLMPMRDATLKQLDRLWDYIQGNELATMTRDGGLSWHLSDEGKSRLSRPEQEES